jgi:hypothetical protein
VIYGQTTNGRVKHLVIRSLSVVDITAVITGGQYLILRWTDAISIGKEAQEDLQATWNE